MNGWISLKDRWPEVGVEVLVWGGNPGREGCVVAVAFEHEDGYFFEDNIFGSSIPNETHWRPLPDPPAKSE